MAKQNKAADKRRQPQRRSQKLAERDRRDVIDGMRHQKLLEDTFIKTAIGFLNAEADTGLNLAGLASRRADHTEERARNRLHARHAYDTIQKYLGTAAHASSESLDALQAKIKKLREQLIALGENV